IVSILIYKVVSIMIFLVDLVLFYAIHVHSLNVFGNMVNALLPLIINLFQLQTILVSVLFSVHIHGYRPQRKKLKTLIMPFDELGREYHNTIYTML
ncbi:MAG TPA: hypothetical protein VE619_09750, partial [Nitrososphaeraceae archaeon]|nr:hypothetical protein [Nitrososphaeraceae archaeon]